MRRALQILAVLLLGGVLAVLALDLRHKPSDAPPKVISHIEGHGPLLAGAAKAEIHVPYPVVPAGYGPKDRHEVTSAAQPQYARAIALQVGDAKLTLVSVDLLEIDSELVGDVKARIAPDEGDVWICATHTHSGMGDYDPNLLAQVAGTGRYKPAARDALFAALVYAIGAARNDLQPASLVDGRLRLNQLVTDRSRSGDAPAGEDALLSFQRASRSILVDIFGAHPTLVTRPAKELDGDYPARLLADAFFQGAVGNVSIPDAPPLDGLAKLLLQVPLSEHPEIGSLEQDRVRIGVPAVELHTGPSFTHRASSNLVDRLAAPRTAELSVAKLGPLTLIAVPGEPTAAAGRALQHAVGDPNALIFGLCNGYVGYIETPDRVEKGIGEAPRQYFDATLLDRFVSAAKLASASLNNPSAPAH